MAWITYRSSQLARFTLEALGALGWPNTSTTANMEEFPFGSSVCLLIYPLSRITLLPSSFRSLAPWSAVCLLSLHHHRALFYIQKCSSTIASSARDSFRCMRFPVGFAGSLITASAVIDVARPDTFVAWMEGRVRRERWEWHQMCSFSLWHVNYPTTPSPLSRWFLFGCILKP